MKDLGLRLRVFTQRRGKSGDKKRGKAGEKGKRYDDPAPQDLETTLIPFSTICRTIS